MPSHLNVRLYVDSALPADETKPNVVPRRKPAYGPDDDMVRMTRNVIATKSRRRMSSASSGGARSIASVNRIVNQELPLCPYNTS